MNLEYRDGEIWDTHENEYLGECAGRRFVPSKALLERPQLHHRVVEQFAEKYLTRPGINAVGGSTRQPNDYQNDIPGGILLWAMIFDFFMLIVGLGVGLVTDRLRFSLMIAAIPGGLALLLGVALYYRMTRKR